jgi:hypothetical protein
MQRTVGIRWPKIIRNTLLWENTGEKPLILQIIMRKWRRIGHTLSEGCGIHRKASIALEAARSQKERKAEAKLEKDCF